MKKRIPIDALSLHDVPEELDGKILLAAAFHARRKRRRSHFLRITAAAASMLFAGGIVFAAYRTVPTHRPAETLDRQELLRLGDWSELDRETYNLDQQIDSGRQAFAELAVNHL